MNLLQPGSRLQGLFALFNGNGVSPPIVNPQPNFKRRWNDHDNNPDRLPQQGIERRLAEWDNQVRRVRAHQIFHAGTEGSPASGEPGA